MELNEYIVDFDAREMDEDFRATWPQPDLDTFLLKTDIAKPLSVDRAIWKSVLQGKADIIYAQTTWPNLRRLKDLLVMITRDYWIIAISQFLSDRDLAIAELTPSTRDPAWRFLGYDVADITLLSGLMDMGYSKHERAAALQQYASALNRYHLFAELGAALHFASWADKRDAGHGPFIVCGLYLIEATIPEQI